MKILSDFDGVWTNPVHEADCVRELIISEAARLAGVPLQDAVNDFLEFGRAVIDRPHAFGWAPDGRISAFVDEDPFCLSSALAGYLGAGESTCANRYRDAIVAADSGPEIGALTRFADGCFLRATEAYRVDHPPAIVGHAGEVVAALKELGAELVVCSNSPSEKLVHWFGAAGIEAGEGGGVELRVHGGAGKQTLGDTDESIEVAGRRIFVDRPRYRAVIEEECPDLVIGDVFSLDLALPHVLRTGAHPGAPRRIALHRHDHTPAWVADTSAAGAIDFLVDDVAELVDIARSWPA